MRCKPCLNYGLHVYYCSKACQQSDWKVHKKICGPKYDGTLDILGKMTLDGADGSSSLRVASGFLEMMENLTDEQVEGILRSAQGYVDKIRLYLGQDGEQG